MVLVGVGVFTVAVGTKVSVGVLKSEERLRLPITDTNKQSMIIPRILRMKISLRLSIKPLYTKTLNAYQLRIFGRGHR